MDVLCKTCKIKHNGKYGSGIYCSKGCANTRSHSTKTREKISKAVKYHINSGGNTGGDM